MTNKIYPVNKRSQVTLDSQCATLSQYHRQAWLVIQHHNFSLIAHQFLRQKFYILIICNSTLLN